MTEYGGYSYPAVSAYLYYEDVGAALEFLARAFAFTERMRNVNPDGSLSHCEMAYGDSVIMLGSPPNYRNPERLGAVTVGIHVHVDDVDAHYARAVAAGATAEREPVDMPTACAATRPRTQRAISGISRSRSAERRPGPYELKRSNNSASAMSVPAWGREIPPSTTNV